MRFLNSLKRFRQSLRRGGHRPRPEKFHSQPRVEELEDRMLLSTLNINFASQAVYTGGSTFGDNLILSEKTVSGSVVQRVFNDPVETINVTGPGAGSTTGGGTHTVVWTGSSSFGSITVNMQAFADAVDVQSNDVPIMVTPPGLGGTIKVEVQTLITNGFSSP